MAQERIFVDEKMRFSQQVAVYNELIVLKLNHGSLSIDRLLQSMKRLLVKHTILRTSLRFTDDNSILAQNITSNHHVVQLIVQKTFDNQASLEDLIHGITINPSLFDLSVGRVFHCEILRKNHRQINQLNDRIQASMQPNDVFIIGLHHTVFDRTSRQVLLNDLRTFYNESNQISFDGDQLQYIDYSVYERLIDMSSSRHFWYSQLKQYDFQRSLSLPKDRHRSSTEQRSGDASVTHLSFEGEISQAFLDYASSHNLTLFQLGLATFYAFLFKLTHGQTDLCITGLNANRYRSELQNMIGMFVATLPHRLQLDSRWSFDELVKHVQEKCLSILTHAHYPLQQILADQQVNQLGVSFLELVFDLITTSSDTHLLSLNDATFEPLLLPRSSEVAKFDFMLTFIYDPSSMNEKLSFRLVCSHDLFNETTVGIMARRFQHLINQLFMNQTTINDAHDQPMLPIHKLSLILPQEADEIQQTLFAGKINALDRGKGL